MIDPQFVFVLTQLLGYPEIINTSTEQENLLLFAIELAHTKYQNVRAICIMPKKTHEDRLRQYVDEQAEAARVKYLELWAESYAAIQSGNEREAELILAGYLLTISDGYEKVEYRVAWDVHNDPEWGTIMGTLVDIGGFTSNFLFRICIGKNRRHLAVTLDALDTRQRSPESIINDRGLLDAGCQVLNFTDSEVIASAPEIAEQISNKLSDLVDTLLAEDGYIRGPIPTNVTPLRKK